MRFLYGDSVPFPPQHAALERGLESAVLATALEIEALRAVRAAEENAHLRGAQLQDFDAVHGSFIAAARHALGTAAMEKAKGSPVQDYATRIIADAERLHLEVRRHEEERAAREREGALVFAAQKRAQVRLALETMLVAVRLPVIESRISMVLDEDGCALTTWLVHGDQLVVGFALGTQDHPEWQKPRKVSDFAQGVTMPVGLRRSLFKRTVQHEPLTLDDLTIGGFDVTDEGCHVRFRRRHDQPDFLELELERTDAGAVAHVHHLETGAEGLPSLLDATDAAQLERFWTLLRSSLGPVQKRRARVLGATLGGRDVFEHNLTLPLVTLVIRALAPVAEEVARRSPNPMELSLKLEHDGGRCEEIYLKKAVLGQKLANVATPFEWSAAKPAFEPLDFLQG